jgi:hypothetical protein
LSGIRHAPRVHHVVLGGRALEAEDSLDVRSVDVAGQQVDEEVGALGDVVADQAAVCHALEQAEGLERQPCHGDALVHVAQSGHSHDQEQRDQDRGLHFHESEISLHYLQFGFEGGVFLLLSALLVSHSGVVSQGLDLLARSLDFLGEVLILRFPVDEVVVGGWGQLETYLRRPRWCRTKLRGPTRRLIP